MTEINKESFDFGCYCGLTIGLLLGIVLCLIVSISD